MALVECNFMFENITGLMIYCFSAVVVLRCLLGPNNKLLAADFVLLKSLQPCLDPRQAAWDDLDAVWLSTDATVSNILQRTQAMALAFI
jgi:hypothetical protein